MLVSVESMWTDGHGLVDVALGWGLPGSPSCKCPSAPADICAVADGIAFASVVLFDLALGVDTWHWSSLDLTLSWPEWDRS